VRRTAAILFVLGIVLSLAAGIIGIIAGVLLVTLVSAWTVAMCVLGLTIQMRQRRA
jgi:hypothetical protein